MPGLHIIGFDMSGVAKTIEDIVNNGLEFIEKGFGVTAQSMFIQLLATLILFLAVKYLFWNKITAILEKRKAMIDESFKAKDEAIATSVRLAEENQLLKEQSRKEASEIIENAKKRSSLEAEKIVNQARDEANNRLQTASDEIEMMKIKAEEEIKTQIVDVAYLMAEKIVGKEINHKKYDSALEEALQKVDTTNGK